MKAPEKGQDLEGGSKKYLSTASLTQCVNISIYAVTPQTVICVVAWCIKMYGWVRL